jgi:RNA-directed DNA polymerase
MKMTTVRQMARIVLSGAQQIFPHVQHIGRRIGTKRLTIAGVVVAGTAGVAAAGEWLRRQREKQRGTMQGGALSPLLANIYLHPFDLAITSQGFRMVRFMDDFVIMCASREDAAQAMELARKQLATLRLVLNEEKTQIVNYEDGLEFLGQALVPRQRRSALPQGWTSFAEAAEALRRSSVHALKRSGSKKNNTKRQKG